MDIMRSSILADMRKNNIILHVESPDHNTGNFLPLLLVAGLCDPITVAQDEPLSGGLTVFVIG